jgi:murein DD-endopeptidase MepM/ murein hydrolase activator NlpD
MGARPWLAGSVSTIAIVVVLAMPAIGIAGTGGAPTPAGSGPTPGSPTGAPAGDMASAGTLSLTSAQASPRKSFYYGIRYPSLRYSIGSDQPANDLQIEVVDTSGAAVRTYYRNDVVPHIVNSIRWDGNTDAGRPASNGRYSFRIVPQGADAPARRPLRRARASSAQKFSLGFAMYGYAFPILGAHDYGGSGSVFGAGRSGHTHQGHDVMARCGVPLVAARGGRVQYSGYQSAAGNYVVIDGRGTGYDMAYMHLLSPSALKEGMTVRTGQPIGLVGSTGSSSACHLHFEMWAAPGWYEGGSPVNPLSHLKAWDRYS